MVKYLLIFFTVFQLFAQEQKLTWSTIDPKTNDQIELGENGSIQSVYFNLDLLPDPFVGENEFLYRWMETYNWELKSNFTCADTTAKYFFSCDWIDTYCSIFINDKLVYHANNAFLPHRFEITSFLNAGNNHIRAVFSPPKLYHKTRNSDFQYPAPNDVEAFKTSSLTRKPQFQFGWDWAPRMNTIGFIDAVKIEKNISPKIENYQAILHQHTKDNATTEFVFQCSGIEDQDLIWESKLFGEQMVQLNNSAAHLFQRIENPRLWKPNNLGNPKLYYDEWILKNKEGTELTRRTVCFGLKNSTLVYEKDSFGKGYYFLINGEKVFCKGANYIPQDIFPSRVQESAVEKMVLEMAKANFNMIRVWGGGYYPMDRFYEMCDSLGIMVWQDFMFACAMYPGDEAFLKNVEKEALFQVKRLAKHPSVVLFNGNNEVDVAWKNWGFQKEYGLSDAHQVLIENEYERVFKKLLPSVVSINSEVSYIHTSPLSNWGKPAYFDDGTMHYWGVWHGQDSIEDLWKKTGRFNAEYGFQSFPSLYAINQFSSKEEQNLESLTMKNHQKSYVGNEMISKHADRLFGKSENFQDFVYKSQLTQAYAIGNAIISHRLDFPRCGGTLFWQFNDCWPAPTWSSIDVFMNKKAMHYEVEKNYAPVSVAQNPNAELGQFHIINDTKEKGFIPVTLKVISTNGKLRFKTDLGVFFKGDDYQKVINFKNIDALTSRKSYLLIVHWKDFSGKEYERRYLKKGRRNLPKLSSKEINVVSNQYDFQKQCGVLKIKVDNFAQNLWITSNAQNLNFDRNFVSLEKGVHTFYYEATNKIDEDSLLFLYLNK
ncbi:MAG: glycosyl hydrolase 2 galactose-binding domain-containing protein [Lishizhenia sp.]